MSIGGMAAQIIEEEKERDKAKGLEGHSIIAIVGNPGTGKSLFLTGVLCWEHAHGRTAFTTYHVTYPTPFKEAKEKNILEKTPIRFVDFGRLLTLLQAKHKSYPLGTAVLGLDEISVGLDSRESRSTANIYLTKSIMQCRKLGLDVYYVAQLFSRVDKSVRNMTGLIIVCEKELVPYRKDPRITVPKFIYHFIDNQGEGEYLASFAIEYDTFLEIIKYYDTQERVEETEVQLGKEKSREMIEALSTAFEESDEANLMPPGH